MKLIISVLVAICMVIPSHVLAQTTEPSDEHVLLAQIQTGGSGSGTASEEYVLLFNPSSENIVVTEWCIEYSSAADNAGFRSCIQPSDVSVDLVLEAGGFMTFATESFVVANSGFLADFAFSGGMAATAGHIRLLDHEANEIDKVGWGEAVNPESLPAQPHLPGEVLSRDLTAQTIDTNDNSVDFSSQSTCLRNLVSVPQSKIVTAVSRRYWSRIMRRIVWVSSVSSMSPTSTEPSSNALCQIARCER